MRHIIDRINGYPRGSVIILLLWMSISIKRSFGNTKCRFYWHSKEVLNVDVYWYSREVLNVDVYWHSQAILIVNIKSH